MIKKGRGFQKEKIQNENMDTNIKEMMEIEKVQEQEQEVAIDEMYNHQKYSKSVEGWIVFVSGIHEEAQEDVLLDKFSEFGQVVNIHLNLDRRTGFVKGYCLVEFEKFEEARNAIAEMNGKLIYDQTINCDFAFLKHAQVK